MHMASCFLIIRARSLAARRSMRRARATLEACRGLGADGLALPGLRRLDELLADESLTFHAARPAQARSASSATDLVRR